MRSYVIDSLEMDATKALAELLDSMDLQSSLGGIYWLPVPADFLTEIQKEHVQDCGPYVMALELDTSCVHLEFLVRAKNALHCTCVAYADTALQQHMMEYVNSLFAKLHIHM